MLANCKWRVGLVVIIVTSFVPSLSAVIMEVREYHGKKVSCFHSGLRGVAKLCGTEGYARVFTGTVTSSVEVGDTDKLLQILPDEVFVGDSTEATAIVNQACLGTEINVGDTWLFHLGHGPQGSKLTLGYDSPSKPTVDAEDDVSLLRDLGHLTDTGIIAGTIERLGESGLVKPTPLANHKVIAMNGKTGEEHSAYTSKGGHFTFQLPVGTYDVTPSPEYDLVEVNVPLGMLKDSIPVQKQRCWEHDLAVKASKQHCVVKQRDHFRPPWFA